MVKQELQVEAVRLLVLLRAMYGSRAQHHRVATTARCTRCDGSLPSPLHLAIKRNGFQMMFPPAATWTRAVGLRGRGLCLDGGYGGAFQKSLPALPRLSLKSPHVAENWAHSKRVLGDLGHHWAASGPLPYQP